MKYFWKIFLYSFLIYLGVTPLRGYSFKVAMIVEGILYFALTYWLLKKHSEKGIKFVLLPLFLGQFCLELPMRLFTFTASLISFWGTICTLWATILAILFYKCKFKSILIVGICVWLYGVAIGHNKWREYVAYGTLPDTYVINLSTDSLENQDGSFPIKEFRSKYVLLDFWGSHCSVCFEKFPKVQHLYDKYKNNPNITIVSVFIKYKKENLYDGEDKIQKLGYNFPVYCINGNNPIQSHSGINGIPTVLLLDEHRNLIFRGTIESAESKIKELLE